MQSMYVPYTICFMTGKTLFELDVAQRIVNPCVVKHAKQNLGHRWSR